MIIAVKCLYHICHSRSGCFLIFRRYVRVGMDKDKRTVVIPGGTGCHAPIWQGVALFVAKRTQHHMFGTVTLHQAQGHETRRRNMY